MSAQNFQWQHRRGTFDLSRQGILMGVLNVTPDSFSDGGRFWEPSAALARAEELESEGADIIDIGGESTRPGAESVSPEEELRRVLPVIRGIRARSGIVLSIDTQKAVVAEEALRAGADIINDISALRADPDMAAVAARHRAGVILMHMQGTPATMQASPAYGDVVVEIREFLRQRLAFALECGMLPLSTVVDPGIGFGKLPGHNRGILRGLADFLGLGRPVAVGISHKSFLHWAANAPGIADRRWPGVAATSFARERGARIFRVHEPAPHRQALRLTETLLDGHD